LKQAALKRVYEPALPVRFIAKDVSDKDHQLVWRSMSYRIVTKQAFANV
jgi:hypothetical protein